MRKYILFLLISLQLLTSCSREYFLTRGWLTGVAERFSSFITQLGATTTSSFLGASNAGSEGCVSVATDNDGNVYCAGYTDGSMGETNAGGDDAFVMKTDKDGNLIWLTQLGDETETALGGAADLSGDEACTGVAVDADGFVYCAGTTEGNLNDTNASLGTDDIFLMRLNPDGSIDWIRQFGTNTAILTGGDYSGVDACNGVAVSSDGNFVYCAGHSDGDFSEVNAGVASDDVVAIRLNAADGTIDWITHMGATIEGTDIRITDLDLADRCLSVTIDSSNNLYCSGITYSNVVDTQGGNGDIFVIKFTAAGAIDWMFQLGDTLILNGYAPVSINPRDGDDWGLSIDLSPDGTHLYVAGNTESELTEPELLVPGVSSYVLKINPSTGVGIWLRQFGATTEALDASWDFSGVDGCWGVTADNDGNAYCAGWAAGNLTELHGGGSWDSFLIKIDSTNNIQWLKHFGNITQINGAANTADEQFLGITLDRLNNLVISGATTGDLGEVNGGPADAFVLRLTSDGNFEP